MRRFITAAMWLYSTWYLGSMISAALTVPDLLGPLLGSSAGLIVDLDPRGVIWRRSQRQGWSPT